MFLTLTYDDANLKYGEDFLPTLHHRDFQLFAKKFRKATDTPGQKYYMCGEYGTRNERPHYHAIWFNAPLFAVTSPQVVADAWGLGFVKVGAVNIKTIRYVAKYCMKRAYEKDETERRPEYAAMSRGLGASYITPENIKYHLENNTRIAYAEGNKFQLPRYYMENERMFSFEDADLLKVQDTSALHDYLNKKYRRDTEPGFETQYHYDQIRKLKRDFYEKRKI